MPIEIRELNVKIDLSDQGNAAGVGNASHDNNAGDTQQKLVEIVTEKVLEILREKQER